MTLHAALTDQTVRLGDHPAVVFLDATSGERTELGFATLHNWVSKTANLLLDAFDLGPGAEVGIDTPLHWLGPVIALGTWAVGGTVRIGRAGDVVVSHEEEGITGADLVIGAGLGGRPLTTEIEDVLTVVDILAQPDEFVEDPGDDGAWAVGGRTQATLLADALTPDPPRLLHVGHRISEDTLVLVARTLPAGTGVVLASGFPPDRLGALAAQERAELQG